MAFEGRRLFDDGRLLGQPEMVDRYIGGWATRMVLRGSRSTTGENISLALPLYAKFVNMDQFHCGRSSASRM